MNKKFLPILFSFSMIACQTKDNTYDPSVGGLPDDTLNGPQNAHRVITTATKTTEVVTTKTGKKIVVKNNETVTSKTK